MVYFYITEINWCTTIFLLLIFSDTTCQNSQFPIGWFVFNMATAVDESAANAALTKTFDSKTTADLERVTDYEEDKEISPVNIGNVSIHIEPR